MTGIVYEPAALRILARMPAHDQAALRRKVRQYADTGIGDVLKLAGSDERRLRHGDWRAIFVVRTDIIVIRIAHRRDAYR